METRNKVLLLGWATFSFINFVKSQPQQGFISLDCGLPSNESPYNETFTKLTYISDSKFIQGGKTGNIQININTVLLFKPYKVLRYFPDGIRNCYSLNVTQDTKYLIRTMFVYGNYDGLDAPPRFDLYLGPNIWTSLDLKNSGFGAVEEIIHITRSNNLDICVVKTGTSTPLISAIELRPLPYDTYKTRTGSLKNLFHIYFSDSNDIIRYPQDVYDRRWIPEYRLPEWTLIRTTRNITYYIEGYVPPQDVIRKAAMPSNASEPFTFTWELESTNDEGYAYLHFADIQQLRANETREFRIVANSIFDFDTYSPLSFEADMLVNPVPLKCEGAFCRLQLIRTPKSTLPPLISNKCFRDFYHHKFSTIRD